MKRLLYLTLALLLLSGCAAGWTTPLSGGGTGLPYRTYDGTVTRDGFVYPGGTGNGVPWNTRDSIPGADHGNNPAFQQEVNWHVENRAAWEMGLTPGEIVDGNPLPDTWRYDSWDTRMVPRTVPAPTGYYYDENGRLLPLTFVPPDV